MTRQVVLTADEWEGLPVELGRRLAEYLDGPAGAAVTSRETGVVIRADLTDWLTGVLMTLLPRCVGATAAGHSPLAAGADDVPL